MRCIVFFSARSVSPVPELVDVRIIKKEKKRKKVLAAQ
jgi:hypothetical protein